MSMQRSLAYLMNQSMIDGLLGNEPAVIRSQESEFNRRDAPLERLSEVIVRPQAYEPLYFNRYGSPPHRGLKPRGYG